MWYVVHSCLELVPWRRWLWFDRRHAHQGSALVGKLMCANVVVVRFVVSDSVMISSRAHPRSTSSHHRRRDELFVAFGETAVQGTPRGAALMPPSNDTRCRKGCWKDGGTGDDVSRCFQ